MTLSVRQFLCLQDNYGFLAHDEATGETAAIDTPDAEVILAEAARANWTITQIWNTHHHFDHTGGNLAVKAATNAPIFAPSAEAHRIQGVDHPLNEGDRVSLGQSTAQVIETPGHTAGHIAYHFADDQIAFVGDTLFALGCGRLFEGTAEQMWTSLSKLTALPRETTIYCAHEYTQANAQFARTIEPDNAQLAARAETIAADRAKGEATVPTTIGLELDTNPFVRPRAPAIRAHLAMPHADDAEVFAEIRRRKDAF